MDQQARAAFIIAQAACANAEVAAMQALNMHRQSIGASLAYSEEAFMGVIDKYVIGHNAVIGYLQEG